MIAISWRLLDSLRLDSIGGGATLAIALTYTRSEGTLRLEMKADLLL